jgi:LPXTG-motif cell wall-anchored protein
MRNILRLRVLGILLLALGLFGGSAVNVAAQDDDGTPPASGLETQSVTVSAFISNAVFVPTLTGGFTAADDNATPADISFSIYLNGDLDAAPFATGNTSGGAVVFDAVPFGTHTITLDDYELYGQSYSWDFQLDEDNAAFLTFLIPGDNPGNSDISSLVLTSYAADQVDVATFYVSEPIDQDPPSGGAIELDEIIATAGMDIPFTGAYVVDRLFYIYANGDTDTLPINVQTVGGVAVVNALPTGTHLVTDAQTGVGVNVAVADNSVTVVTAVFPEGTGDTGDSDGDPDTEAPGSGNGTDDGDDDGSDDGSDDGDDSDGGSSTSGGDVSSLPSTGQGSSNESSTIVMILGAMSLVALAGGFAWRQRRTA